MIKHYKDFIFRVASAEDTRGIIELFERNYKKPMGLSESYNHYCWEYINNPVNKLYILLAISENRDIAAQYALLPKFMKVFSKDKVCALSQDTITDEKYRGRGLFVSLAKILYDLVRDDKILFTYGFPNKNSAHGFFSKLGWVELKPIPIFFKPIYIKGYDYNLLPYLGDKFLFSVLYKFAICSHNRLFRSSSPDKSIEIREINNFEPIFDEIWMNIKRDNKIIVVRDNKYIKWRYFDKPENNYKKFIFYKDSKPVGYLVTSILNKYGLDILFVVDFLLTLEELTSSLISKIDSIAVDMSAPLISIMIPSFYKKQFLLSGYLPLPPKFYPQELHFGIKIHNYFNDEEKLLNINNWYLTWGDSDVV